MTASLSCLLSRFATGPLTAAEAISARAAGTLSRPRIVLTAAPATSKQVSAIRAMALVKLVSFRTVNDNHFADNWELIKA